MLLFICCASVRCETGLTAAPILVTPMGARSSSMGRAFTAVHGDADALNYNPAGLAFINKISVSMTYMRGFDSGDYGFIAVPMPVKSLVLTPGFLYYNSGKINVHPSVGADYSVTAQEDKVTYISVAWMPVAKLGVGATLKYSKLELAEIASANSINYDFGILYDFGMGLTVGASYLNNGSDIKFEEKGDAPPKTQRLGASYKLKFNPPNLLDPSADISYCDVVLSMDWSRTNKESGYYQAGGELNMGMPQDIFLSLRFGYLIDRPDESTTFGIGIGKNRWSFNYSSISSKELSSRNQVTLGYKF